MAKAQEELGEKTVEGTAGGGIDHSYCKWS